MRERYSSTIREEGEFQHHQEKGEGGEVQHHQEEGEGGEVQHHQDEGEGWSGPVPPGEVWEKVKSDCYEDIEDIVLNTRNLLITFINHDHRVAFLILLIARCTRRKYQSVSSMIP